MGNAPKHMIDSNGTFVSDPTGNYAFITNAGVHVLATKGQTIYGEAYRNYGNEVEWRVLNYAI